MPAIGQSSVSPLKSTALIIGIIATPSPAVELSIQGDLLKITVTRDRGRTWCPKHSTHVTQRGLENIAPDRPSLTCLSSPFLGLLRGANQALLSDFEAPLPCSCRGSVLTSTPSPLGPPFPGDLSSCWSPRGTAPVLGDVVSSKRIHPIDSLWAG